MTAKLVISFDFELGWGVLEGPEWRRREQSGLYSNMRPVLRELFDFLSAREVPSTWAFVSSMLAENPHDLELGHLPSQYQDSVLRFFSMANWETRCGVDLFEDWSAIAPFSELCSHSSTHIYADYEMLTAQQYLDDVKVSIKQLAKAHVDPVCSLVCPRDQTRFLPEIQDSLCLNIRLGPQQYFRGNRCMRILRGGARFFSPVPPSRINRTRNTGTTQTGSMYFNWHGGDFAWVKSIQVLMQGQRLLKQLKETNATYHIWLHPFNLAESGKLRRAFLGFLHNATILRDRGEVDIVTMEEVAHPPRL